MRRLILIAALLVFTPFGVVADPKATPPPPTKAVETTVPPTLSEMDALRLEKLNADRALAEERLRVLVLQHQLAQQDFAAKSEVLRSALDAAAAKAGLKLGDGWSADTTARTWVKRAAP